MIGGGDLVRGRRPSTEVGRVRLVRWNARRTIGGGDLARRVPTERLPRS
jgi:hypothetical protein